MKDTELLNIWKSYDQKLNEVLSINKELIHGITRDKLNSTIAKMRRPKKTMLLFGVPYTIVLYIITLIAYNAGSIFVALGFGAIALIMTIIIIFYFFHLHLINRISRSDEVLDVQEKISRLKISTFNTARMSVIQLPFWSVCWISLDALKNSLLLYGGVNLIVFLGLSYLSYWLFKNLSIQNSDSKISKLFLSGINWEPIIKSSEILEQLKEYKSGGY